MNYQLSQDHRHPLFLLSWIILLPLAALILTLVAGCDIRTPKPGQDQSVVIVGPPLDPPIQGSDFALPPENVKALRRRGIHTLAVLDENDTIRGVVSLHEDGTCQTCKYIGPTSEDGKPPYLHSPVPQQQGLNDWLPFPPAQAVPKPPCPHKPCGCPSGHCRFPAANCCNC